MYRLYKPARSKESRRGLFSFLTESVLNMVNFNNSEKNCDVIYYHDLYDIPGYGTSNVFDICFTQDENDFIIHRKLYKNVEDFNYTLNVGAYDIEYYDENLRISSEEVVKKFFIPNQHLSKMLSQRHKEINFEFTIGVHRRSTDIIMHHNIVPLEVIFESIESTEFNNIFLMCDNHSDLKVFKKRYGNKLITYDEFTSKNINLPFFKINNSTLDIHNHVKELLFGVFTLSKTKEFICTRSNISSFCLLSNSKLNYKLLN